MSDLKIKCDHMGKHDVVKHTTGKRHQDRSRSLESQSKLNFSGLGSSEVMKRTEAELKLAVLTASGNIPMAFHDTLSPSIRSIFPDSKLLTMIGLLPGSLTCVCRLHVLKESVVSLKVSLLSYYSVMIHGSCALQLESIIPPSTLE